MQKTVSHSIKPAAQVSTLLLRSLAETSIVTMKAQNYHWNVEGMAFKPLHDLFQEIYEDHFEAQDSLAERIRALDVPINASYARFLEVSSIDEAAPGEDAGRMVDMLRADQEKLSRTLRTLAEVAEGCDDIVTNDLAIGRAQSHDKFAWMLRSHLRM
jgi:starvation-inducible DNA-binding protein